MALKASCLRASPRRAADGRVVRGRSRLAVRVKSTANYEHSPDSVVQSDLSFSTKTSTSGTITLYYRSGWDRAYIHGSAQGAPWQDYSMKKVTSAPGKWLCGNVLLNGTSAPGAPLLEFVVTNGAGEWDKPTTGNNYLIEAPGTYTLRGGSVKAVQGDAVMVVSDLDGTMVGDDKSTAAFKSFWEDTAVVRGGVLVYNTGRSLESFQQLLASKAGVLARPDLLISAVGTKIYDNVNGSWEEDKGWEAQLQAGWNLTVVREAAYAALAKVGKERMHFRPPDEQNQHKVTCGVKVDVLASVVGRLQEAIDNKGVAANIITSGTGDWRFVDVVSKNAGKLEALEYARRRFSFPINATVACGDSGNDILMLSGENPAIVVGNAQPDLVRWVEQQKRAGAAMNGKQRLLLTQRHEALGILEGLEYFGFK